jgi:SAM-dependent methyltransferase
MPPKVPGRVRWAVEMLAVESSDRILEIGCGHGIAVNAIAGRLQDGRIVAIDRSARAIAQATANNARHIRSRTARLVNVSLADATIRGRFDKALAINVNVFWLGPAKELAVLRRVLRPKGRLYLCYEPPSRSALERATVSCQAFLEGAGWTVTDVRRARLARHHDVCIIATPPA